MRVLITGGAGFIGSNLVHYWRKKYPDDELVVLDKLTYAGHKKNLDGIPLNGKFNFIRGDITNEVTVNYAMNKADVVIHLAAESHVDRSIIFPHKFIETNEWGTLVLLEEARKSGVKLFHHVSTDEVFGSLPLDKPLMKFDEKTPYNPRTPYAVSKANSDFWVRTYHETYGLPITITNTSNNFGPWQDPEKLIPRFITNLLTDREVPLMGKGENVRDWIYVKEHCRAIDLVIHAALKDESIVGETFCVGGNSERTNMQVTKELLRLLGKDESWIEHIPHRLSHDARYAIDSSKIRNTLGWEPTFQFEDWLAKTVVWYQNNVEWWKPLKEGRPVVDPEVQQKLIVVQPGRERK